MQRSFENNFKPTLEQLWDNLTKTLGQLGDKFEITLGHRWHTFKTTLGSHGDLKVKIGGENLCPVLSGQHMTIFMGLSVE